METQIFVILVYSINYKHDFLSFRNSSHLPTTLFHILCEFALINAYTHYSRDENRSYKQNGFTVLIIHIDYRIR